MPLTKWDRQKYAKKRRWAIHLHLTCPNMTTRAIAERVGIAESTVCKYLTDYYASQRKTKNGD